jgi:hypothetical protein
MTALPAPEPPATATNPPARRDDGPHATLTFSWDRDGLSPTAPTPGSRPPPRPRCGSCAPTTPPPPTPSR